MWWPKRPKLTKTGEVTTMNKTSSYLTTRLISGFAYLTFSASSLALDYSVDIGAGVEHQDNAAKTTIKQSDNGHTAKAGLNIEENSKTLELEVDYDVNHTDYNDNIISDRTTFVGNTSLKWTPSEELFSWSLSHNIRDTIANRRFNNNIDNSQQRSDFSTGPTLKFKLSKRDRLVVDASYQQVDFDTPENTSITNNNADSMRAGGGLKWARSINDISQLQAGVAYSEVERDELNQNTKLTRYYIGYTSQLAKTNYSLKIGSNKSKRESSASNNGLFVNAQGSFNLNGHTIDAIANRQQTETGIGTFVDNISQANNTSSQQALNALSNNGYNVSDTVELSSALLRYSANAFCERCNYYAEVAYTEQDYNNGDTFDQEVFRYALGYNINFSRRLSLETFINQEKTEFIDNDESDSIVNASLTINYKLTPTLRLSLTGRYENRGIEEGTSNSNRNSYDNTTGLLTLHYRLIDSKR